MERFRSGCRLRLRDAYPAIGVCGAIVLAVVAGAGRVSAGVALFEPPPAGSGDQQHPTRPIAEPPKTGQTDQAGEKEGGVDKAGESDKAKKPADGLKPIDLKLPRPVFRGTPKNAPPGTNLEKPRKGLRPPFLAPPGVTNVAKGKPVISSDDDPIIGSVDLVTDGDAEAKEGTYVELGPGVQYVQIDLKKPYALYAIVVWHYHTSARIYHDVVVRVADDKDFITNVRTLFNNDHDNSSGLGIGNDKEYWETYEGKLIVAKGAKARYVRLYSNGSIADDQNHYIEVRVFGKEPS